VAAATPRTGLTRDAAITSARWHYQRLVERAVTLDPSSESYVVSLARSWAEHLDGLRLPAHLDTSLPDHVGRRFAFLAAAIEAVTDPERALAWVDAFPNAISELLPPSQSTFHELLPHARSAGTLRNEDRPSSRTANSELETERVA
jgi:hypothetical protein